MLSLYIDDEDITIHDLDKNQLKKISEWFNGAEREQYKFAMGIDGPMTFEDLYEKYLEALVSTHEFFLSINRDGELAGFIKGRVDYRDEGEIWIMALLVDTRYQSRGVGKRAVRLIMEEFREKLGIKSFYAYMVRDNAQGKLFWEGLDFKEYRMSKGFFTFDNGSHDLIIMHRHLDK